jgi:hypothetical protein
MAWTCPDCNRIFKNKNQSHSCIVIDAKELFKNKNPLIFVLYEKLILILDKFNDVRINPVKNAILLSAKSNFMAIKPKTNWLDIEFVSSYLIDEFPIHKSLRVSKNKFANFIRIQNSDEIDNQLTNWIIEAYKTDIEENK